MIIQTDNRSGKIVQVQRCSDETRLLEIWKENGVNGLVIEDAAFGGLDPLECKIVGGKPVKMTEDEMAPSQQQLDRERKNVLVSERMVNQPLPIHSFKLLLALTDNMDWLEDEAAEKGISTSELKEIILEKAKTAVSVDVANTAEMDKLNGS